MHSIRFSLLTGATLVALCGQPNSALAIPDDTKAPITDSTLIAEGIRSAIEAPRQTFIKDKAAFAALWAEHSAHENPAPTMPRVNFAADTLVAVFAGNQPTGGHAIALAGLDKTHGGWELRLSLISPGPDCMTTQAMTQPWMMIRVPGHDQPVNIRLTPTERPCGQ